MVEKGRVAYSLLLEGKRYDCEECKRRGYYKERNCDGGDPPRPQIRTKEVRFLVGGQILHFCPQTLLFNEEVIEGLQAFAYWKKGVPYTDGGLTNQPAWIVDLMLELQNLENKYQEEQIKRISS